MKKHALHSFLLPVLAAAALAFGLFTASATFNNKYTAPGPGTTGGVTRLTAPDLSDSQAVFLARGWEFYQYQYLTPERLSQDKPLPNALITIGQAQGFDLGAEEPHGSATYRQTLLLDSALAGTALFLEVPEVYGSYALYINGVLSAESGDDGAAVRMVSLPRGTEKIELLLAVSDDHHFYSGLTYPPALGTANALNLLWLKRLAATLFAGCTALLAGVFYLVLGLKTRAFSTLVPYGLLCLAFIGASGYPLVHMLAPGGEFWYSLEHLCGYLQFLLLLLVCGQLCGLSLKKQAPALAAAGLICLAVVLFPLWGSAGTLKTLTGFSLLIDFYKWGVVLYLAAALLTGNPEPGWQQTALGCGLAVFAAALVCDRLYPLYEPIVGGWMVEAAVFIFILILAAILLAQSAHAFLEVYRLRTQNHYTQLQLRLEENRYSELKESIEATARLRHDLRQHYRLMRHCLDCSDYEGLRDYLDACSGSIPQGPSSVYCAHRSASLIIAHYLDTAKALGWPAACRAVLPQTVPFSDTDLCVLLGNALENAVDACRDTREPFLDLSISIRNSRYLVIILTNRCRPGAVPPPGHSSKGGRHCGIGLTSMAAIAEKYQGTLRYEVQDSVFTLSVILHSGVPLS
ncbi:ATP-binding protein [Eubacterium sp. 1001713B170207_170306_E7]|uniref:ATP-binding protein n=1 Tax=Eubacterium sp. 1001713B170207_170306_E7 TaxID=2787097 RepID=UPI00189A182F|nr:ATP-binding protein [Eubacterium sp. 1001713B170207_170306_E7]